MTQENQNKTFEEDRLSNNNNSDASNCSQSGRTEQLFERQPVTDRRCSNSNRLAPITHNQAADIRLVRTTIDCASIQVAKLESV
eukprot:scaffold406_cov57-Cylindrotheca_fusiformis.AAC.3